MSLSRIALKDSAMDSRSEDVEIVGSPSSESQLFVAPHTSPSLQSFSVNTGSPNSSHGLNSNVDQHGGASIYRSYSHGQEQFPLNHNNVLTFSTADTFNPIHEEYSTGLDFETSREQQSILDADLIHLLRVQPLYLPYSESPIKTEPDSMYHPPAAFEHDPPSTPASCSEMISPLQLSQPQFPVYHSYPQQYEMAYHPTPHYGYEYHHGYGQFQSAPQTPGHARDSELSPEIQPSEPYAKLIYRCLLNAPNHTLVLNDIYNWFQVNSDKIKDPRDPKETGWKNSIRHNLSMNKAFDKVALPTENGKKNGCVWRLSEEALRDGVQSTTRFRNKQPHKRYNPNCPPSPHHDARRKAGMAGGRQSKHNRNRRNLRSHAPLMQPSSATYLQSPMDPTFMHSSPLPAMPVTPVPQRRFASSPFDPTAAYYTGMMNYAGNPYTPSLSAADSSYMSTPLPQEFTPETPFHEGFGPALWDEEGMAVEMVSTGLGEGMPLAYEDLFSEGLGSFGQLEDVRGHC